jgi:transposase
MDEREFSQLPPAAQAYIRELEASNRQLGERVRQYLLHVLTQLPQRAQDPDTSDLLPFRFMQYQASTNAA